MSRRKRTRPKGRTVHVRAYCRRGLRKARRVFGKNQRGESMPF